MAQATAARPGTAPPFKSRASVRLWRLKALLGQLFYKVGEAAELDSVRFWRALQGAGRVLARLLWRPLRGLLAAVGRGLENFWTDLTAPFHRAHSGASHIRELVADEQQNGAGHAARLALRYLGSGVRRYAYLGKNLLYYLLPLGAGAVFVFTVVNVLDATYVLAVENDGQVVGYVRQEAVYEEAARMVQDQIIYTGDEQHWALSPTFTISAARAEEVSDSQTLADAILRSSGEEITEAVGLYVDGQFYGATTEGGQLEAAIAAIKAPYEAENPGAEIGFVKSVELRRGIYLAESVKDYSELQALFDQPVQGQRTYTIQAGDTPLIIAGANDITLDELYALNPVLENGSNMPVGQELIIGESVSFLQVKVVKTQVEQEEIPFETIKTDDDSLDRGKTKTTQQGVKGLQEVTYQYTYIDGRMVDRTQIGDPVVLQEPVEEHISVGTYISQAGYSVTPSGSGGMIFPVGPGFTYMSRGFSGAYAHNGLDLCAAYGTPIYAAQSGVVTYASATAGGYGIHVIINHGGGVQTLYGHCSALVVGAGQSVARGQVIAYVGSTGNSTGNHCHFEVIINGARVNGAPYVGI